MKEIALDMETYLIRPGLQAPKMVCMSWYDGERGDLLLADEAVDTLRVWLSDHRVSLVNHNIAYDFGVACAMDETLIPLVFNAYSADRVEDTVVNQMLIAIGRGTLADEGDYNKKGERLSLDALVLEHLGLDISATKKAEDAWRYRYAELDGVPLEQWPQEAKDYAQLDAVYAWQVAQKQRIFDNPNVIAGQITNARDQARAAWVLHLLSCWGVRTDGPAARQLYEHLTAEKLECDQLMEAQGLLRWQMKKGQRVLTKNTKALQELLTSLGSEKITATGRVATDRETIEEIAALHEDQSPLLKTVVRRGKAEKLLSTYVPTILEGANRPITPRWNVLVATGRTSCSKPNLQNPPRSGAVRECFIPRPGYVYGAADYSYIELVCLAQVCKDLLGYSLLGEAINEGTDPHLSMAAEILGWDYDRVVAESETQLVADHRQLSKALNFGFPGGLGADAFVDYAWGTWGVRVTSEQAAQYRKNWYARWLETKEYHNYIKFKLRQGDRYIVPQLRSNRIRLCDRFTAAANSFFQGKAADGAKAALYHVSKECYTDRKSPLFGARPVMFLHDENILEIPEERASEAMGRLQEIMVREMRRFTPDVQVKVSGALMRRWYKKAKAVYDEQGRMVPWEPVGNT